MTYRIGKVKDAIHRIQLERPISSCIIYHVLVVRGPTSYFTKISLNPANILLGLHTVVQTDLTSLRD